MSNFFENQELPYLEIVTLAEDIILPEISTEPLTLEYLQKNNEYKFAYNEYSDIDGKFFFDIYTPMVDKEKVYSKSLPAPSTKGFNGNLHPSSYIDTNYIVLTIPKYIVLNFKDKIPKGTKFLLASVGASTDFEYLRIVGIYSINEENNK